MDDMNSYHKPIAGLNPCKNSRFSHSSRAMAPRNYRYPEVKSQLRRLVHAPSRVLGLSTWTRHPRRYRITRQVSGIALGGRNYNISKRNPIDVEDELRDVESMEVEIVENVAMEVDEVEEKTEKENEPSLEVIDQKNWHLMMDNDSQSYKKSSVVSKRPVTDVWSFEAYRKVLESAVNRTSKLKARGLGDILKERWHALFRSLRSFLKEDVEPVEDAQPKVFLPLSKEEETAVKSAFSANNMYDS